MTVQHFYEKETGTLSYVVFDEVTKDAVVIDPVLNYTPQGSYCSCESVQEICDFLNGQNLSLKMILETHIHADHLSGASYLKEKFQVPLAIGEPISEVQKVFKGIFNYKDFKEDAHQFDRLLKDGESFSAGSLEIQALSTPGHTPACFCYKIGEHLFTGDAIFLPDKGTGRCDFPGGSAEALYDSVTKKLYTLPESTKVYVGHDYPEGRDLAWKSTVLEQKTSNIHIKEGVEKAAFVKFRTERDRQLALPRLFYQSLQVNMNGGEFLKEEGHVFLKIPVDFREGKS